MGRPIGGRDTFLGASTTCLRGSAIPWVAWVALSLADHLTACLSLGAITCLGRTFPEGEEALASWEVALSLRGWLSDCLSTWEETKLLLGGTALASWEVALSPACLPEKS